MVEIYDRIRTYTVSARINKPPVESGDDHTDSEDDDEFLNLEREGYAPGSQVEICTAQAVRVCPPGSASMVDVRGNSGGSGSSGGRWRLLGLRSSSSVRDVASLPDLSSAHAVSNARGKRMRERDEVDTNAEVSKERRDKMESVQMLPAPEEKGLRRALKKRISTQKFNFQGGGVRELVRSIGF